MKEVLLLCAFQGVPGAFSHDAGRIYCRARGGDDNVSFVACPSFADVFQAVVQKDAHLGVVPLENSSIGSITASYDLLWRNDLVITGEVSMPVHHCLLGLPGADISALREVYSHAAALEQCRKLFAEITQAVPVAYTNTAGAASLVRQKGDPHLGAIASELAALEYGLAVLKSNVEDYPGNCTRFGIISRADGADGMLPAPPAAPYKISCAFELEHSPGKLSGLLSSLSASGVNLSKIESRPIPETAWHYRFFIDLEAIDRSQDALIVKVLAEGSKTCKILGRYKSWHALQLAALGND
jgi:prephenate dehydratase